MASHFDAMQSICVYLLKRNTALPLSPLNRHIKEKEMMKAMPQFDKLTPTSVPLFLMQTDSSTNYARRTVWVCVCLYGHEFKFDRRSQGSGHFIYIYQSLLMSAPSFAHNDYIIMTFGLRLHGWWLDGDYKSIKFVWIWRAQGNIIRLTLYLLFVQSTFSLNAITVFASIFCTNFI